MKLWRASSAMSRNTSPLQVRRSAWIASLGNTGTLPRPPAALLRAWIAPRVNTKTKPVMCSANSCLPARQERTFPLRTPRRQTSTAPIARRVTTKNLPTAEHAFFADPGPTATRHPRLETLTRRARTAPRTSFNPIQPSLSAFHVQKERYAPHPAPRRTSRRPARPCA